MTEQDRDQEGWFRKLKSYITVEPVLVFYIFGSVAITGLNIFENQKACATKLGVDLAVCEYFSQVEETGLCTPNMINSSSTQMMPAIIKFANGSEADFTQTVCWARNESIIEVTLLDSYRNIITSSIKAVVVLFAGSWSDRVGLRKPCILVPIAADILNFMVLIMSATFMREVSLEITGIVPYLFTSLSGGSTLMLTGILSYLTVITSEQNRAFRFACVIVIGAAVPIVAHFFSGHLFKWLGFIKLCLLCTVTDVIALIYGLFVLKEPSVKSENNSVVQRKELRSDQNNDTWKESWRKLFDLSLIYDFIRVLTRKRNFNQRNILILFVVVYFINFGAHGDRKTAVDLANLRFNWVSNLGTWVAYDLATTMLGTLLVMGVLSKRFGVSDALICVFSVCFTLVAKPIMAYAVSVVKPYLYYVATSIDVFEDSKSVAIRSMVSKLVEQHEIGKIFALLGLVEAIEPAIFQSLFSTIHLKMQGFFIGTVFLVGEIFLLVSLGLYITLYFLVKDSNRRKASDLRKQDEKDGIDNPAMEITAM